jgi:hypothetical protein
VVRRGLGQQQSVVPVDDPQAGLGVDAVVDREVARGTHGTREVDPFGGAHPRRADRDAEHVDALLRHGEGVARVVDRRTAEVEDVAGVVEARQVGMDHGVQLADRLGRDAGVERLSRADDRDPLADLGRVLADLRRDRGDREHRGIGAGQRVGQVMVGVLVGDHHRVGPVDRLRVGEHPGVEDDHLPVVLEPDAGVAELGDPHDCQPRRAPHAVAWWM